MHTIRQHLCCLALAGFAAACQPVSETPAQQAGAKLDPAAATTFAQIGPDEAISLVGTEPFWGGTVARGNFLYTTPEVEAGETIAVRRFAGNNGLGFSGTLRGTSVDLAITPGNCSDGMSDRTFPFVATLRIGAEQRSGCAWTARHPFTGER